MKGQSGQITTFQNLGSKLSQVQVNEIRQGPDENILNGLSDIVVGQITIVMRGIMARRVLCGPPHR
jgi:hypothetical protein